MGAIAARYRHRCVADLAWAVSSPPLLLGRPGDCTWFESDWYLDHYREIEARLHQLDRDPVMLESLLAAQKDQRLGNYFETLWSFALELNPRYRLVERNLQIIDISNNLGDAKSLITHPASTTHRNVGQEGRDEMGISDGMVRLSVGLEDTVDLIKELRQAFAG